MDIHAPACGSASTTFDVAQASDAEIRLQAARAVRRALADAGRKAADVGDVWLSVSQQAADMASPAGARRFVDLALGRFAASVGVHLMASERAPGGGLDACVEGAVEAVAAGHGRVALAVSVGFHGRNVALAFCSAR